MDLVTLFVGRSIPSSLALTGGMLIKSSFMWTNPKRNSFTSVCENKCVSVILKNRACTGVSKGKLSEAVLMLLASVLPSDSCKSPAPKGRKLSESEKKKRAETLSLLLWHSRSQFVVN